MGADGKVAKEGRKEGSLSDEGAREEEGVGQDDDLCGQQGRLT